MNKLNEVVTTIVVILFYLLMGYMEIWGIYHTAKKHSDEVYVSIFVPPWAWYRSIEYWWHEDFPNVDWDTRVPNDIRVCIYFLNRSTQDTVNMFKLNQEIQEFSDLIRKYPKEKFNAIEGGAKLYLQYSKITFNGLRKTLKILYTEGKIQVTYSDSLLLIERQLKRAGITEETQALKQSVMDFGNFLSKGIATEPDFLGRLSLFLADFEIKFDRQYSAQKTAFKTIFNKAP